MEHLVATNAISHFPRMDNNDINIRNNGNNSRSNTE